MDFFEKLTKGSGGYIFLSHSHEDIEKVRIIRDALEKAGFEPLCFYLKCLRSADEIEDLIKREIDAREWFIFLDSENARRSKWVTMERKYVMKSDRRKIINVDLADEVSIRSAMEKMLHDLRIYFSYSARDEKLARRIKNKLEEKDYLVFFPPDSIPVGTSSYTAEIASAVSEAARDGCVLALLTENFVHSDHWKELMFAYEKKEISFLCSLETP